MSDPSSSVPSTSAASTSAASTSVPLISVVVPVRDSAGTLSRCLAAIAASEWEDYECLVVDDGSEDRSGEIAASFGFRVIRLESSRGPAAARNAGAVAARGRILLFVDADVVVEPDTLGTVASHFEDPDVDAVIGSYDSEPSEPSFLSRYRNLFHHYIHQNSDSRARTFWAGCGAVCRERFLEVGGFNEGYRSPSVEDIELGYRLCDAGCSLLLDHDLQVKHLKKWTFRDIVRTDVHRRGIPWSRLLFDRERIPADLNLRLHHRISGAAVLAAAVLAAAVPPLWLLGHEILAAGAAAAVCLLVVVTVLLNLHLYRYLARLEGVGFALRSIPLHLLYYLYSPICVAWGALTRHRRPADRPGALEAGGSSPGVPAPGSG